MSGIFLLLPNSSNVMFHFAHAQNLLDFKVLLIFSIICTCLGLSGSWGPTLPTLGHDPSTSILGGKEV